MYAASRFAVAARPDVSRSNPIELGYDAELKRLVRYRGLSNIGDGKGQGQVVDIRYRYEDLPQEACDLEPVPR